ITRLQPGEGLWARGVRYPGDFRILIPDPETGQIGMMALIETQTGQETVPALLAVRLKVEGGAIVEAEHIVGGLHPEADTAALQAPRPNLVAVVPGDARMARDELAAVASSYYEALANSDGTLA